MPTKEKHDTREVMTLNYALSTKIGNTVYTFSPSAAIIADTYVKSPALLRRIFEVEQETQRRRAPVDDYARWDRDYIREKDIFGAFRESVKSKEGTYGLVDSTVKGIFFSLKLYGERAMATVKSKSDVPGQKNYNVMVRNLFLGKSNQINLKDESCGCPYFSFKTLSGGGDEKYNNECVHINLARDEMDKRLRHPEWRKDEMETEGDQPHRAVFQPFMFSRNWNLRRINQVARRVIADYPSLASLEIATLVKHYMDGVPYAELNKQLLQREEIYSPIMTDYMRRGLLDWRIIRKDTKEAEIPKFRSDELKTLGKNTAIELNRQGYRHKGYSLVFGREAERYEKGPNVIEVVFSEMPPFYVHKTFEGKKPSLDLLDNEQVNPFTLQDPIWADDFTKTVAGIETGPLFDMNIGRMQHIRTEISDDLRAWYRSAIPESLHEKWGIRR